MLNPEEMAEKIAVALSTHRNAEAAMDSILREDIPGFYQVIEDLTTTKQKEGGGQPIEEGQKLTIDQVDPGLIRDCIYNFGFLPEDFFDTRDIRSAADRLGLFQQRAQENEVTRDTVVNHIRRRGWLPHDLFREETLREIAAQYYQAYGAPRQEVEAEEDFVDEEDLHEVDDNGRQRRRRPAHVAPPPATDEGATRRALEAAVTELHQLLTQTGNTPQWSVGHKIGQLLQEAQ